MTDRTPDPELVEALERRRDELPSHALSPASARRQRSERIVDASDALPVRRVRDVGIRGPGGHLPIRLYEPSSEGPRPVVVYLHSGGWVVGNLDTHDPLCRALATETGYPVVAVDYRRAPEHTFPTALLDAYSAVKWVTTNDAVFDVDPDRVVVAGDSAGGNLAAATALLAVERPGPEIAHQVLLYPVTDSTLEFDSYEENAEWGPTRESMAWYWDQYLDHPVHARNPLAAPLKARDMGGLPPATVVTCGFDGLRDEGNAYAHRLQDADVPVTHLEYDEMTHGFVNLLVDPAIPQARRAVRDVAASIVPVD